MATKKKVDAEVVEETPEVDNSYPQPPAVRPGYVPADEDKAADEKRNDIADQKRAYN